MPGLSKPYFSPLVSPSRLSTPRGRPPPPTGGAWPWRSPSGGPRRRTRPILGSNSLRRGAGNAPRPRLHVAMWAAEHGCISQLGLLVQNAIERPGEAPPNMHAHIHNTRITRTESHVGLRLSTVHRNRLKKFDLFFIFFLYLLRSALMGTRNTKRHVQAPIRTK